MPSPPMDVPTCPAECNQRHVGILAHRGRAVGPQPRPLTSPIRYLPIDVALG